jgi:hypothetical protein
VYRDDDLTTFIVAKVEKIRSLNLPDSEGHAQACIGKTLLYLKEKNYIVSIRIRN